MLILSLLTTAYATENDETGKSGSSDAESGTAFTVEDMFPGDSKTQDFVIEVSHNKAVTLYFHADIRLGYDILAEVLQMKVELPEKDMTLYDGLMRDMPESLEYDLAADEKNMTYLITVYLDTGIGDITELDLDGKRYMYQKLVADFSWWYLEDDAVTFVTPDNVKTGDDSYLELYVALSGISLVMLAVIFVINSKKIGKKSDKMNKKKRLQFSVFTLVLMCFFFCVTSLALTYASIQVDKNYFQTGGIDIDLNNGEPVIIANEVFFAPGMTVERPFYIKNNGNGVTYYKLYFSDISGNIGDVLDVTILDEDGNELLSGKLSKLTKANVATMENALEIGERQDMTIRFQFPEFSENIYQGGSLTFEFSAIAVQTKNNLDKEFE